MYNVMSPKAEEFISHEEILESLAYAEENKQNRPLIDEILNKAREKKGLSHREAAVLLDCELEDKNQEIYQLAEQIKKDFYGNRIVMFAPLYISLQFHIETIIFYICPGPLIDRNPLCQQQADNLCSPSCGLNRSGIPQLHRRYIFYCRTIHTFCAHPSGIDWA